MDSPFSEWTREEKDAFARKKMEEMKLRNEKLKLRHAEVENDRKKAEAKNSSVTSVKILPKEKPVTSGDYEDDDDFVLKPKVKEREWDIGKDMEDWNEPKFNRQQGWKNYSDKRHGKKEDSWRVKSTNGSKEYQASSSRYRSSGRSWSNKKYSETNNQATNNYRNDNSNFVKRSKGYEKEKSTPMYQSRRKSCVKVEDSASQSPSDSEYDKMNLRVKNENDHMWRMDGSNDVRHRQIRVEKWVKSINNTGPSEEDGLVDLNPEMEYHSRNLSEYEVGLHEKGNEGNYAHPKHSSLQGRSNKARGNDKKSYTSKGQKEGKRKAYSNKSTLRQESDASDHVSSAKESDYPGYKKEKSGKICHPKSSDNSEVDFSKVDRLIYNEGDEIWDNVPEQSLKTQFPGKENNGDVEGIWSDLPPQSFNTPIPDKIDNNSDSEGIWSDLPPQSFNTPVPDKADNNRDSEGIWSNLPAQSFDKIIPSKVDMNSDVEKSKILKLSSKQRKNKSHMRNLSSSDYSGTCENPAKKQSDRRSNWKRSESHNLRRNRKCGSKLKAELKPSGSSTNENSVHLGESHESSQEYDPSILVKIESHTVKRTFFNNNFTDPDKMECNSSNEPVDYSQNKNESDIVPENMEEDSIEINRGDYEYCEEFQHNDSVGRVEYYDSFGYTTHEVHYEDQDRSLYFGKLCIFSSPEKECGSPSIGGALESETENYVEEPCKREYINSNYLVSGDAEELEGNVATSFGENVKMAPRHIVEVDSHSDEDGIWSNYQQSFSPLLPGIESSPGIVAKTFPDLVDQPLAGTVSEAPPGLVAHLPHGPMVETIPGPVIKAPSGSVFEEALGPVIELSPGPAVKVLPKPVVEDSPIVVAAGSPIPVAKHNPKTVINPCKSSHDTNIQVTSEDLIENAEEKKDSGEDLEVTLKLDLENKTP